MTRIILTTEYSGKPAGVTVEVKPEMARRLVYLGHARLATEDAPVNGDEVPIEPAPRARANAKEATA
ncbi:hypothetical protein [Glutamicibacter sp. NPDC087583]|uniref:hypothetical protein n=1 Tax=Glutamicibacter sp. NPDC087583 TaxID=3363995 RepID=UPI003820EAA2